MTLTLADFDFELPGDLIAQRPLADRVDSRLLHVGAERLDDLTFADVERLLAPGDLLVVNDTRVIKARLIGKKESGGRIEALVERVVAPQRALALLRSSHPLRPGTRLLFSDDAGAQPGAAASSTAGAAANGASSATTATAIVRGRSADGERFELDFDRPVDAALQRFGRLPLPPYIAHQPDALDEERYQTVYARAPGAVAAPTAGLHFSAALLERLARRGVETVAITLDVGAATFQPLRCEHIEDHRMHGEQFRIEPAAAAAINRARAQRRRIVAVGTTSLRALESAASDDGVAAGAAETRLFITPGYRFRVVDRLITNFHLPRSTLLMLVAAFAGLARIRAAYAHAIGARYRFYSYGDAMLLERAPGPAPHEPP